MSMNEKSSKSTVIFFTVVVICLAIIAYYILNPGESEQAKSLKVDKMQEMTVEVQGMETEVKQKKEEVAVLQSGYEQKTGKKVVTGLTTLDLTHEERQVLQEQIGQEKDVSARALLKAILAKTDEIRLLKEKIGEIESQLPAPHLVKKGETHYQVALSFLVDERGVEKERAQEMLKRVALFEELAEGYKVWNFYNGVEFGTAVTQGESMVSPNTLVQRARKKIIAERDQAVVERDQMAENVKSLEEKQEQANSQLNQVNLEKGELSVQVEDLNKRVNSVFYCVDSVKNLKKQGILKAGFLVSPRLRDVPVDQFNRSLDLNIDDQLVISAEELGVKKIKNVVLYPNFYKKGSSYTVLITKNQQHALITLMDKEKFKSERLVIAVN